MNQRLEQFVHDHREDFDTEEPARKVWDKIRLEMEPPKEKKTIVLRLTRTSLSVAAAILLVIAVGFWYLGTRHTSGTQRQDSNTVARTEPAEKQQPAATADSADSVAPPQVTPEKLAAAPRSKDKDSREPKNAAYSDEQSLIREQMVHYSRLVELKQQELKIIEKDEPMLYKQFASDFKELDHAFHNLQFELNDNPNSERVLEAMLQNLQLQMGLLNHQLDVIKQINHSKQKAYEKAYKTI
ncbi:MAG TPA: hypothetical protein VIM64_22300 [Puia sp.]